MEKIDIDAKIFDKRRFHLCKCDSEDEPKRWPWPEGFVTRRLRELNHKETSDGKENDTQIPG